MLRLLQLELQKLWLNKTSKMLIVIALALPFFIILLAALKINVFGLFTLKFGELGIFDFPLIWHLNTFFASYFKFFFAIVVVSMIGQEYSNKTLKQNLIDGLSKKEFVLSKFYAILFFSLLSTLLVGFMSLCLGLYYSNTKSSTVILKGLPFLGAYFVKLVGFFSLCLCLAMLTKRSAFALAFLLLLFIGEWLFYGILSWNISPEIADSIRMFLPLESMYNLIEQPFQRIAMLKFPDSRANLAYDYAVHFHEIAIVMAWIGICMFITLKLLQKRDL
jgi:ABC-type transport system involved in multi-copper enzyme maturation permease subunit